MGRGQSHSAPVTSCLQPGSKVTSQEKRTIFKKNTPFPEVTLVTLRNNCELEAPDRGSGETLPAKPAPPLACRAFFLETVTKSRKKTKPALKGACSSDCRAQEEPPGGQAACQVRAFPGEGLAGEGRSQACTREGPCRGPATTAASGRPTRREVRAGDSASPWAGHREWPPRAHCRSLLLESLKFYHKKTILKKLFKKS